MKYILGGRCTFMGLEFFQSEILSNLVAHEINFQCLVNVSWSMKTNPLRLDGNFMLRI